MWCKINKNAYLAAAIAAWQPPLGNKWRFGENYKAAYAAVAAAKLERRFQGYPLSRLG